MQTGARSGTGGARLADGGAGIVEITSSDGSIIITNPNGPIVDLSVKLNTIEAEYLQDASLLLGHPTEDLANEFSDWGQLVVIDGVPSSGWASLSSTGVVANSDPNVPRPGGQLYLTTSALAGAELNLYGRNNFLPRTDTGVGYAAFRVRFESPCPAAGTMWRGFYNYAFTRSINVGIVGAYDVNKIVLQYDGATRLDLIPVDTDWHVYKLWWLGDGVLHIAVDGVEIGLGVIPASPIQSDLQSFYENYNGPASAVAQTFAEDWRFVATPREV